MEKESMSVGYFQLIFDQLIQIGWALWADQDRIKLLKMDVRILEVFFMCLDKWKYMIDEESMERLRCVNLIWPKDFTLLSLLLERMGETRPIDVCIQDFDSVMFDLERLILRSKQQVEGWCRNSMMHSSMLQCKYSDYQDLYLIFWSVQDIQEKLILSRYRTGENVSLKKQIDILRAKREFLEGILQKVLLCPDVKEIAQFMYFIGHFANSVACLTCLYWAKEDCDEIASEMNMVLFDMLQNFIPYAYDITPFYIGILKSDDLHLASDSFLLGEAVENFVDFFFDHLATVLKDDFLFLRDRLLFLFTFLTDPPCENAEEGDLIRSQIYAILHEDAYLLLSFDEMNKDFCDKKALLSAFMIRIDIANANIRQLYRGSSESWITLEVEKMEYNYFVSLGRELSSIEKHAEGADKEQLLLYKMELRFLRVFLLWLATWDDTDEEIKVKLRSIITSFRGIWGEKEGEGLFSHRLHAILRTGSITDWHPLEFELQGKIQQSKLETEAWCVNLFQSSFQFKTSTSYKILKLLDSILGNLNDLVICKASEIVSFKNQIETLEEKLMFLKNFSKLAENCKYYEELGEFTMFVQAFANEAACLTFLYWAKDANAKSASETNCILSHMLRKIKPATPDVVRFYFGTLMAIYVQRCDSRIFGQTAFSFVNLFLEDLVTHLKDDDFQILQDNIVFLLTFLNDPPNQNAEELIGSRIDVPFWEGLYGLIPFDNIEGGFSEKKVLLSDFMMKIEAINANIRSIYGKFPDSSLYNFPKVISPQFLDFLLHNLRNLKDRMNSDRKYVPFAKYKIIKIEEELVSFCPFFNHIFDLKIELKDTWLEVVNVLHLTEHVIMSCISSLFVSDHPFWYHMAYLSDVIDEIKVVKAKLEMIKLDNIMNNARYLPSSVGFSSEINEIIVGFEDEKEKIIGMLTRGPESLDIVSIVGMGGLGKTTLAKKVFDSSLVKCHFDVFAFCSVSLDHNTRRLLLDIIHDIKGVDDIIRGMTNDDLAHLLWKCLSRQKYLIVLDDVWNVSAWNEVKSSFPDNQNGSRVMFTTRSHEVADKCRVSCSPHQLRFMSEVESWELLQKKVFRNGISPPYLYEIGKQIAKNCKGLALAVVVIGGLLARTEKSPRWWSEVSQKLAYYLSNEGCMEILELSYKHLPENLKPCLLYLGAFPEDSLIRVKQVIRLWIAEGFVQESKTKSLEDVAKEYFYDLVGRSLIIVSKRSSGGGIKTFRVHDLIHELCQTKCRAENFFRLNHQIASSSSSEPSINNHYRVSAQNTSDVTNVAGSSLSTTRTVHFFSKDRGGRPGEFLFTKFRLVQVLGLGTIWQVNDINQLTSLIHLRYMDARLNFKRYPIPWSTISNLWNITSLKLNILNDGAIHFPETFWRMKSLRYVKVFNCILKFPDDDNLSSYQIMDKVVSFSTPVLSTGKDAKRLLQRLPVVRKLSCFLKKSHVYDEESTQDAKRLLPRLPAVRKLSCFLKKSHVYDEESTETLDFYRELESLVLFQSLGGSSKHRQYMINFPSTLKKLTLVHFVLHWTDLSAIAELHCLEVLKLRDSFIVGKRLETEDLVFRNLKFFHLYDDTLVEWNASTESFPCLEQLEIECRQLKELPPCFGEISTLKRIFLSFSPATENSAHRIQEEVMELGIQLQLSISSKLELKQSRTSSS